MQPSKKESTISKLIERFREKTPSRLNHNFCLKSRDDESLDLSHTDFRTELGIADPCTYTSDAYFEDSFEISSPMPISKISIHPRPSQRGKDTITKIDPRINVANFRSDSLHTSSDILQEWRAKRKNEILKYKYHTEHSDNINERKQDYYQRLTDKYLPTSKYSDPITNPSTQIPTDLSMLDISQNATATPPALPPRLPNTGKKRTQQHQCTNTLDYNEVSSLVNDSKTPVVKSIRDNDNVDSNKVIKTLTNHSVQTLSTREVEVQTTPPPSPPTRGPMSDQMQEQWPDLDESCAWSISSLTTEDENPPILSEDPITSNVPSPEIPSVTDRDRVETVNRMEQDELLKLLIAKATLYEQHIHNIDKLLNVSKIKS